jgi:hypothetical protein
MYFCELLFLAWDKVDKAILRISAHPEKLI